LVLSGTAFAGGDGVLFGTVIDSATKRPISDVVVTATSPNLQGEQIGVSDETGLYRVSQLPPGIYALRFEREGYRPFARGAIALRVDTTLRFNVELLPEVLTQETVVVAARAPTVDVGSTQLSTSVGPDLIQRLPLAPPGGKNGAVRSFESLAELAPTGQADQFGFSLNGSTSNENNFVIDGLSVNDPAYATLGSPLSLEFIREVNVISGGYMPEFGRSTGGVFDVVTKSGSNEFHGSIFSYYSPGSLNGSARQISREASAISTTTRSFNIGSLGGEVGGPISKDKLWFYVGFSPAYSRFQLERNLNAINFDAGGTPIRDSAGLTTTSRIPGTQKFYFADQRSYQYIGKLTYLINRDHNLTLSFYGTPTSSGGNNALGIDPNTGAVETNLLDGQIGAIGHQYIFNSTNAALKYSSSWLDKRLLFDATAGWHHQSTAVRGMDGSQVGSSTGLASISDVWWASGPYDLRRFEPVPNNPDGTNPCDSTSPALRCPVASYNTGGPRGPYWPLGVPISEGGLDRVQGRFVGTYFASGLGHHIVKAGLDLERLSYHKDKGIAGTVQFADLFGDGNLYDYREFGYLQGPDRPVIQSIVSGTTHSNLAGLFLQDSWSILDQVTVNVGIRYDVQTMQGNDGRTAIALKNEWSPRVGAVYDFTGEGRSKLFASYAKYYEAVPLNMIDRSFPGDRFLFSGRPLAVCNPSDPVQQRGSCRDPNNLVTLSAPNDPNQTWGGFNQDTIPVDPNIKPQENDEVVAGAEYEVIRDGRAGLSYTHRELVNVIEDMSRDEGFTYFIGNPGTGIASDFPKAQRKYDAISFYFAKRFSELWLAQASYTWSRLRGNYSGMFRPENGQLEPNLTSDFDLKSLMVNRTGNLPADHTHAFKFFGAKEFELTGGTHLTLGMSYVARSGSPLNYLGAHYLYGPSEAFILPRGAAGRLPWMHSIDARLGLGYRMAGGYVLSLGADVFNLFNFQAVAAADQNYTFATVRPIENGAASDLSTLTDPTGTPIPVSARNPNFLRPIAYQPPRSIRFSARLSF
jgi:hypothetical protein